MFGKFNPGARTEVIHLRATPDERRKISDAAQKTRRTMTNFVLSASLSAADKALGGATEFDQVESSVAALPPAPNSLDPAASKIVFLVAGLTSNLTQLASHAQRIGGVVAGLNIDKGPIKNLASAALALGLAAKSGQLTGTQAVNMADSLTGPARDLNVLARRLNEGQVLDPRDWHPPISGLIKVLLTA